MKAFIVALLVASVASQSLDMMNLKFKPTHRFSNIENLLLKEKLGSGDVLDSYKYNTMNTRTGLDLDSIFGGMNVDVTMYTFEELLSHPIFREYMQLPLFNKLWEEHPVLFRKYVESPLFQKFWMVPQFYQMFKNEILFVKYIVPQIQVISEVVQSTTEGRYNFDTPTYSKYMPYAYRHSRDWSVPMTMDKIFNTRTSYPTTSTNYRYLLEKMMNQLNKQEMTQTMTDVRMLPTGRVEVDTVGKIVDPFTGIQKITVGDFKTVDEKIVPVQSMDFPLELETLNQHYGMNKIFNTESTKDAILKHIILQKMLGNKVITPSVYETLFKDNEDVMTTPEIYSKIYGHKNVMIPEMLEAILRQAGNKKVISPEFYETIIRNKDMNIMHPEVFSTLNFNKYTPEVYSFLNKDTVMTPFEKKLALEKMFGKNIYNKEVYGTLFDNEMTTPEIYGQYEPTMLKEKMMSPFVARMLKSNKMNKFEKMIKTEKMIEEIKKEKMIEELIKEHRMFNKDTIEFPKMFETENKVRVPLTFENTLPTGLDRFEKEHEIKY